jgi:hypothetical protein
MREFKLGAAHNNFFKLNQRIIVIKYFINFQTNTAEEADSEQENDNNDKGTAKRKKESSSQQNDYQLMWLNLR